MSKTSLQTLMRYKAWANELVFAAVAKLPEAELTAPRQIVFGSLLRTLNHVYAMDEVWRAHLEGRPHGYPTRNPDACPSLPELRDAQSGIDAWFVRYARRQPRHIPPRERGEPDVPGGGAAPTTDLPVFLKRPSPAS